MPAAPVRRRRRTGADSSAARRTGTDSTAATPTDSAAASSTTNSTLSPTALTVPEILKDERQSMSNILVMAVCVCAVFVHMIMSTDLPPPGRVYGIVIDAGSTGTRAQVFAFHEDKQLGRLVLDSTSMFAIKKSLAALAVGVGGSGTEFFKPLLENARKAIPGARRRRLTPISLRATAGLRLLGPDASEKALNEARTALNASEFLFKDSWVSVLDEKEEAVYAWTTVNYLGDMLTGALEKSSDREFLGALELGGASMQMAFQTDESVPKPEVDDQQKSSSIPSTPPASISKVKVFGKSYNVLTKSNLGMGLFDFTKKLYLLFDKEGVLDEGNPCFRRNKLFENKKLRFGVPGSEESRVISMKGDGDFSRCVASAEIVIGTYGGITPIESKLAAGKNFFAFAYFYDRTVKLGLPPNPTKEQLIAKGKRLCETSPDMNVEEDFDEACAEFSYIYAIIKALTNDFSSDEKVSIKFVQYVGEHMLGWALGSILDTLEPVRYMQLALDSKPLFNQG